MFQPSDEVGARDVQQVGGLLRGEHGVHRHHRHALAFGHVRRHAREQLDRGARHHQDLVGAAGLGVELDLVLVVPSEVVGDAAEGPIGDLLFDLTGRHRNL